MSTLPFPLAPEPDPATMERGRKLFAGEVDFVKGVVAMDGLPPADRPEICFAGRSNVGKSSLINALTGRKGLARASNTPGRTQEINYFTLGPSHYLVDLPGYGYAKAPLAVRREMAGLLKAYLSGRATLRRAFVLIDARHGIKPVDEEILSLLDSAAVTFQVVLTKADKVKAKDRDRIWPRSARTALAKHPAAFPRWSDLSETGDGIPTLRAIIAGPAGADFRALRAATGEAGLRLTRNSQHACTGPRTSPANAPIPPPTLRRYDNPASTPDSHVHEEIQRP
jgi:GTP-binding protein